jgi:phage-related protein
MADTSLIFNVIARDSGLGRVLDKIQSGFRGAGRDAEEALAKAGSGTENLDRQLDEAKARVKALAEEFERTGDKTLFSKINRDRSLISQLQKVKSELHSTGDESHSLESKATGLMGVFSTLAGGASSFGSSLAGAGSSAAGMVSSISGAVVLVASLAGAFTVAAPAIYAFGGAAAAIPALLSGAIAAIATLKLGMSGLSENWAAMNAPKTGGGGGGSKAPKVDLTPKIRAVQMAQQEVAKSSREAADAADALRVAQDNVAKAHEAAAKNIRDLNLQYRQAKEDQAEATQTLVEAEQNLRLAQARGNPEEIMKAQMAVDKQRLAVEEATNKTTDLGKESAEAAKKGVEGSDEVVAAKRQEHEAEERLADAIQAHKNAVQRLADAQADLKKKTDAAGASGGALGGVVLPKIARSAQEFLDELMRLKPAFDDLRLDIQQRLFDGLADKLRILAERWLPALHKGLGDMADTINEVVKRAFDSLSDPEFIKNMMVGLDAFRGMLGKIGDAIAGPLIRAWGQLTAAAKPVLDVIGDKISGIIIKFSDWIDRLSRTGALDRFMSKAAHILGTVFDMFTDLARIAGDVIAILFGTDLGSTDAWDNLANVIHQLAEWLGDPKNQANLSKFVNMFGGLVFQIGSFLKHMDEIPGKLKSVQKWFQDFPTNVSNFMSRLPGVLGRWATSAINTLGYWIGYGIGWAIKQFAQMPGRTLQALAALPGVFARIGPWLLNATSNLYSWMLSVGKNIVYGIYNGIVSLQGWLWDRAYDFAKSIWKGVKSALGISSPSRVMADEVGKWIPPGIAAGIDANAYHVHDAMGKIADELAATTLPAPSVDVDSIDADGAAVTVGARRLRIDVRTALDVTGQEGKFKTFVRSLARTDNLYQTQG